MSNLALATPFARSFTQARRVAPAPAQTCPATNAVEALLNHLVDTAAHSPHLRYLPSPSFWHSGQEYAVPHFIFTGPTDGGEVIRLGLFAGIHGDEPEGAHTLVALLERLLAKPQLATGYQLHVYPVCNPTGYAAGTRLSASRRDLNREFWTRSEEPEVQWLEQELASRRFYGLISLHGDDTANGVYAYARGALFSRALARPALAAAARSLPVDTRLAIDGFRNHAGLLCECFEGVLSPPPADLDPRPFEIILETAQSAPSVQQIQAGLAAVFAILETYTAFLASQADI